MVTPGHAPLWSGVVVAHGGRVPGDELAVLALAVVLLLVGLSGLRRRQSRASPSERFQAQADDTRTGPDAGHNPNTDPE